MQYRRLGQSGLKVSALSFGSWVTFHNQVDVKGAENLMAAAYEAGVNFFDNAEAYAGGESEIIMGDVISNLGWGRDSYCVSSKVFWGGEKPTQRGLSRKHIVDACHAALRRLKVDYLDLFFCHRPDVETPIEETVRTMNSLIQQGKILYWGTSEWSSQQIMQAYSVARQYHLDPPVMEQPQYNLYHRQRVEVEYGRLYSEIGLGLTIWSPLASGLLTGKYNNGIPEDARVNLKGYEWLKQMVESEEGRERIAKAQQLAALANELGMSLTHLSIAWCLLNPNVSTVILGAKNLEQLQENLAALDCVEKLDKGVVAKIETIVGNKPQGEETF